MPAAGTRAASARLGAVDVGPVLRLEGLTKRYPGVTALDDLSVEVPRGRTGLVGANGAGKTTTFRLLLGLAHPSEGRVEVCGIDVAQHPIDVRARLGYMPEHDCLPLDQTAADVVSTFGELSGLPAKAARQRASDILDLVGLDEARFRPIGGFSTGMRQRTKLAQALVGDPELVLLDEPTAGLDPLGREEMLELVARLGTFGISVLMATHLLDDVQQVCDHVVMIDAGRLVISGATASLLERTGRVTVDVGLHGEELVAGLARVGVRAELVDHLVEVTIDGDAAMDLVRDVLAELGLPLFRLSTGLTSLDEVFVRRLGERRERDATSSTAPPAERSTTAATGPTTGHAGGAGRRRSRSTRHRCAGRSGLRRPWRQKVAPFVLLGIVTIPAVVNVGHRLRDPRPGAGPHPDHHLPRLRRGVVGPAAVRRHRRARRDVPRPPPARAAADVRPTADRVRLRARQGRGDRDDPVRLLVPAAGGAVRRQHARQQQRAALLHGAPRRPVEGARRGRPAGRVLRRHRLRHLVAHRAPHRRRRRR